MSPERQKRKTLEAILAVLLAMAVAEPVLFIVEDLHWIDPTTLELLTLLLDQAPTARLLTLLAARPTFDPPWPPRAHLTVLTLTRFPRRQTELLVSHVAGGKALPAEVAQQIVAKTDGVPLFVEELTKMVLESGLLREEEDRYELTGPLPPLAIPSTLQDSLMARLDRLATVKEVAQLGATLGRAFPYELLRAVSPLDDSALQQALGRLVEAELLYQRGVPPQVTYLFKHALVQETAYQSLLKSTRQQYHQRIARVLVERFPDIAEIRPEFVAHHYTEAGLSQQAVEYWQRAGQRAVQRSAHAEGIGHFGKALEVLAASPESLERDQQELALQVALGYAFVPAKGWSVPEAERAFTRARVLTQRIPEAPLLFGALCGLFAFYLVRADHRTAREFAEQCAAVAERAQDPDLLVEAYWNLGASSFWRGEFTSARGHVERSISLYDRERHRAHAFIYGQDPRVATLAFLSWALWSLGYPEQAMLRARENLAFARGLSHPFSLAWALTFKSFGCVLLRDWRGAQLAAEENVALSTEQGFPYWVATANAQRGLALAKQGQPELGIAQLKQALLRQRADGVGLQGPIIRGWLAEACECAGQVDEGLGALEEALTVLEKTGERLVEAEIRLRGELSLIHAGPDEPQAEPYFQQAIEIARSQEAKSFELRAATSLSRLWQRQGKRADARRLLSEVYGWFTEGFDTLDLKDAKALLDELQ
jgi:tetratricopeptide (TPR) repeat protein